MKVTGIILAGGKSSRMGKDKSMLVINNNKTLITQVVDALKKVSSIDEIIIVSNSENKYDYTDIKEISDIYPKMGPLGGIHSGLISAKNEYCFFVACDMPYLNSELLNYIINESVGYDVTLPLVNNKLEPLCAVYSKKCIPSITNSLEHNIRRVFDFYPEVKVNHLQESEIIKIVDPKKVFFNVNTPEDYKSLNTRY